MGSAIPLDPAELKQTVIAFVDMLIREAFAAIDEGREIDGTESSPTVRIPVVDRDGVRRFDRRFDGSRVFRFTIGPRPIQLPALLVGAGEGGPFALAGTTDHVSRRPLSP